MFPPTLIVDELYEIKQYRIIYSLWKSMEVWHISRDVWWYNNRAFYQFPERLIYEYCHCNRISIDWGREKKVPRATGISTVYLQDFVALFGLSNLIKWSKPWLNYQTKQNISTPQISIVILLISTLQISIVILLRGCWSGSERCDLKYESFSEIMPYIFWLWSHNNEICVQIDIGNSA